LQDFPLAPEEIQCVADAIVNHVTQSVALCIVVLFCISQCIRLLIRCH
jgi:hypothetical protein